MKKIWDYLLHSNLELTLFLNPFRFWVAYFEVVRDNDYNPGLLIRIMARLGPVKLDFWIDDGSW